MNNNSFNSAPWDVIYGPQTAPSSLSQLLQQILDLIVGGGFFLKRQAFLSLDPDPWPTLSGPFVSVHPGSHRLIPGQWSGAGADLAGYRGIIPIRVADQCMIDPVGRDDAALLRLDQGLHDVAMRLSEHLTGESVAAALLAGGVARGPMAAEGISEPKKRRGDGRWRAVVLEVSVDWQHTYQTSMI